jgi:hypothetical protein
VVTAVLVFAGWVGVIVVLAAVLTVLSRRRRGEPPLRSWRRRRRRPDPLPVAPAERGHARRAARQRRLHGPVTSRRPVQDVAADLRRLARELATVPAGAPFVRWQALQTAYDQVLAEAADQLEVPHAMTALPLGPARDVERLRVVCALEAAGLVVQD